MKFEQIKQLVAEGWSLRPVHMSARGFHLVGPNGEFPRNVDSPYVSAEQADKVQAELRWKNEVVKKFAKGDSIRTIYFSFRTGGRRPSEADEVRHYLPMPWIEDALRNELRELRGIAAAADILIKVLGTKLEQTEGNHG